MQETALNDIRLSGRLFSRSNRFIHSSHPFPVDGKRIYYLRINVSPQLSLVSVFIQMWMYRCENEFTENMFACTVCSEKYNGLISLSLLRPYWNIVHATLNVQFWDLRWVVVAEIVVLGKPPDNWNLSDSFPFLLYSLWTRKTCVKFPVHKTTLINSHECLFDYLGCIECVTPVNAYKHFLMWVPKFRK